MSDLHLTLGAAASAPLNLDLETLIETRMLVTATSGGGKSGAIFQLCEVCSPHVQTVILDPEGEFAPLRAKYPFVLVGPEGETPAAVRTAKLLATRLLELGASAIVDLYELPPHQRHEYVRDFLDALIDAPKSLWPAMQGRGAIVVVDESHLFAPEKGQGESVASGAMANLATRGRKRGLCLVAATQRLAMLSKTLAANCQNVMIGRTSQIDQARAAETLHVSDKTAKAELWKELARMPVGKFYAYGMAFGATAPVEFQVARAKTLPEKKDRMNLQPPPAPAAIQKLLPKLADLPAEVEKKAKTEEDLRADLRTAQQRIRELEKQQPVKDEETEKMLREQLEAVHNDLQQAIATAKSDAARIEQVRSLLLKAAQLLGDTPIVVPVGSISREELDKSLKQHQPKITLERPAPPQRTPPTATTIPSEGLSGPEQRVLDALAWFRAVGVSNPEQSAVAFMAGYTVDSSAYEKPRGRLNKLGMIVLSAGRISLTAEGEKRAAPTDIPQTNEGLHAAVLGKLPGPEQRLLRPLLSAYPKPVDREVLADAAGYSVDSSAFEKPRGRLRTLGLIRLQGSDIYAEPLLFPEG